MNALAPLAPSKPPPVRGGRRVQDPLARLVVEVPYSVTEGYRWVARADLPAPERAMLMAVFVRVCSKTWRWPPKAGEGGGSSMVELGAAVGRSPRHARRLVRALEARGLIRVADCRPRRNEYQVVPEALRAAGEAGQARVRTLVAEARGLAEDLRARADALLDGVSLSPPAAPPAAPPAPPAPAPSASPAEPPVPAPAPAVPASPAEDLPGWAVDVGAREGVDPALVAGLVRAAWRAAGGRGRWTVEGAAAGRAVRRWRALGQPDVGAWEALLTALVGAHRDGALRAHLRRRFVAGVEAYIELLARPWAREAAYARQRAAEAPPPAPEAPAAPEPGEALVEAPVGLVGGRGPVGDPAAWAATLARLRGQLGTVAEVWLAPLVLEGVDDDGRARVRAPSGVFGRHIAADEGLGVALTLAAGGPVRLVW